MPELTLADVERVQGLLDELALVMLRAAGATSPTVRRNAERIMVNYHKAIGGLVAERPALLALAREALERRADRDLQAQADMARADWLEDERRHD